ncbi:unnamed protein product [Lota lota]
MGRVTAESDPGPACCYYKSSSEPPGSAELCSPSAWGRSAGSPAWSPLTPAIAKLLLGLGPARRYHVSVSSGSGRARGNLGASMPAYNQPCNLCTPNEETCAPVVPCAKPAEIPQTFCCDIALLDRRSPWIYANIWMNTSTELAHKPRFSARGPSQLGSLGGSLAVWPSGMAGRGDRGATGNTVGDRDSSAECDPGVRAAAARFQRCLGWRGPARLAPGA